MLVFLKGHWYSMFVTKFEVDYNIAVVCSQFFQLFLKNKANSKQRSKLRSWRKEIFALSGSPLFLTSQGWVTYSGPVATNKLAFWLVTYH